MMNTQERWLKLLSPERLGANTEHAVGHSPGVSLDRSRFQQDYDRIVFTSALRRLKDKTQVFPLAQSDYVRTRLTHSLEASCVGRSLGSMVGRAIVDRHGLAPDVHPSDFGAVVAAACLAHDIGNPPFGHAGRVFRTNGNTVAVCKHDAGANRGHVCRLTICAHPME